MAHATLAFDRVAQDAMDEWKVPGLTIGIVHGEEIFTRAYGFAKLPDEKVTAETLFNCGSISKSFTAAAVAILVEDDENYPDVQWTTPVSKLLPDDFMLPDPMYTEHVSVEDILSHRSGMPGHDQSYLSIRASNPDTPKSVTRNLRNLPLSRPLRTEFQYCNMMYTAASYMIEVLSGRPFPEFLRKRLWEPLQMNNTYHDVSGVQASGAAAESLLASGYRWDEDKENYIHIPLSDQPEGQGAGLVFSNVKDYAKWIRTMITEEDGPLSKALRNELINPRTIIPDNEDEPRMPLWSQPLYALGWVVETYRGRVVIGHGGNEPGFNCLARYLPELNWGVVVFGNSSGAWEAVEIICCHLIDELLNIPASERFDVSAFIRTNKEGRQEGCSEEPNDLLQHDRRLETSVNLSLFAGKYSNPGYHDIVIELKDGKLGADCTDRCFAFKLSFEHLSQGRFIAEILDVVENQTRRAKAEFEIDADGIVTSLGVAFSPEMDGEMIWFSRIA